MNPADPSVQRLLAILRNWWWLAILIPVTAAGAGYAVTRGTTEVQHVARTAVLVGQTAAPASDLDEARLRQALVPTYAELVRKSVVTAPVVEKLQLAETAEDLANSLRVHTTEDTQLIEIVVRRKDRAQAVEIANAVGDQLVALTANVAGPDQGTRDRLAELNRKIAETQAQVESLSAQYFQLPVPPGTEQPPLPGEGAFLLERINLLHTNIRMWQESARDLEAGIPKEVAPPLTIVEKAATSHAVRAQSPERNALLAGAAGLLLAVFLAFALDYAGIGGSPEETRTRTEPASFEGDNRRPNVASIEGPALQEAPAFERVKRL